MDERVEKLEDQVDDLKAELAGCRRQLEED